MKIGVVGLGKLGLSMAALFASKGFEVIGADVNKNIVDSINAGGCPINETGLAELLSTVEIEATTDISKAAEETEATFIMVPTPSGDDGTFINDYIVSALKELCPVLSDKEHGWHILVITSTVMPGSCERVFKPRIEEMTGKKVGEDISLCYNPEFIALGSIIRDMSYPDAILIGESDTLAGDWLHVFYNKVCSNKPTFARMNWWNAELAKISLNCFVTAKITMANTYARICEAMPNGNVEDVVNFLGMDSRIGNKYLQSGLGFAGPCFPRDGRAFIKMAEQLDIDTPVQVAVDTFNDDMPERIGKRILGIINGMTTVKPRKAAILGLTYKPDTPVIEESRAVLLAQKLAAADNVEVMVHDPQGMDNAKGVLGDTVAYAGGIEECITGADIVIIATAWKDYRGFDWQSLKRKMRTPIIFDCWRIYKDSNMNGINYFAVGIADE